MSMITYKQCIYTIQYLHPVDSSSCFFLFYGIGPSKDLSKRCFCSVYFSLLLHYLEVSF